MESKYMWKSGRRVSALILSLAGTGCTHKQAQGDEIEGDSAAEVVAAGQQQDEHQHHPSVSHGI